MKVTPQRVHGNDWEDVADLSATLGITLDSWQEEVLEAALGTRRDGLWAASQVGLSAPRQNGKSQLMVARLIAGALFFKERKIIVSAHQQDTARETFGKFMEIYDESPALRKRIRPNGIMSALNREAITFTNGCKVQFKARAGAGGRGFSSDCLLLDEAQILSPRVWASINSTMSARANPQVWMFGTPPTPDDDGEVFGNVRAAALGGKTADLAYLEWSASPDDDPADERTRWKANPAWSTRINHRVVQDEYATYSRDTFARERLGIWDDVTKTGHPFTNPAWDRLTGPVPTDFIRTYGVKFTPDGSGVALAAVLNPRDGGPMFLQPIRQENLGAGTQWLVDYLVEHHQDAAQIVVDGKSGVGYLVAALREAGIRNKRLVIVPTLDQVVAGSAMLEQRYLSGEIRHGGSQAFTEQVLGAKKRKIGASGGFGFEASQDNGTTVTVDAIALALWGATTTKRDPSRRGRQFV
ncbi:MAG: terminase large subunit domain-containing protein [Galactobacter sp.]